MRFTIREETCDSCGHQHAGPEVGSICIGCPCAQQQASVGEEAVHQQFDTSDVEEGQ